jgi:hypothetical protein
MYLFWRRAVKTGVFFGKEVQNKGEEKPSLASSYSATADGPVGVAEDRFSGV